MSISIELLTTNKEFTSLILQTMALKMGKVLADMEAPLKVAFSDILAEVLEGSPSYKSILNGVMEGELKGELGVTRGAEELGRVVEILQKTIVVQVKLPKLVGKKIDGGIQIAAVPTDMEVLLSSDVGQYLTKKGVDIPWLNWLLTKGGLPIIKGFKISDERPSASRTGLLTMKKASNDAWKVPPSHAGTLQDNFITRALDDAGNVFEVALIAQFKKSLKVLK